MQKTGNDSQIDAYIKAKKIKVKIKKIDQVRKLDKHIVLYKLFRKNKNKCAHVINIVKVFSVHTLVTDYSV